MTRQHAVKKQVETTESIEEPRGKLLLTLLPLIAGLLTAGSVCLHAIGAITHRTFLNEMGVPPDLFPKDVAWTLINGFYAVFDRWHLLFKIYADSPWEFILYCIMLSAILLAYWYLYRWSPKKSELADNLPPWGKAALRFVGLCVVIAGSLPGAVCFVMLLMIFIGAPGEFSGKAQAEKLRERYAIGCTSKAPCTDVFKGNNLLISGVVLDSSQTHIAVYDPQTKLSHVLETVGLELRRVALPVLGNPSNKN